MWIMEIWLVEKCIPQNSTLLTRGASQDTNAHTVARSDKKEWQMPFPHNVAQTVLERTM